MTNPQRVNAGLLLPLTTKHGDTEFRLIRLKWQAAGDDPPPLDGYCSMFADRLAVAMKTSRGFGLFRSKLLLAICTIGLAGPSALAANGWLAHDMAATSGCDARGSIDSPKISDSGLNSLLIHGWAADAAGIDRVELRVNGKLLASAKPSIARNDVAASLPQCRISANSGYAFEIARGNIPPGVASLEVRGINVAGKAFTIGILHIAPSRPFGWLDSGGVFELNGRNLINGWVIAEHGPVKVRVLAQGKEVMSLMAENLREDVAKAYPAWPQAARSGFHGTLPLRKLPRGRYQLKILFEDNKGRSSEIAGPDVINDLPFGKALAQRDKMMPPGNIELRTWVADEDGIRAVHAETESGVSLGSMKLLQSDKPLAVLPDPRFKYLDSNSPLKQGDLFGLDIAFTSIPPGLQRIQVLLEDTTGKVAVLPGPLVLGTEQAVKRSCPGKKLRVFYPGGVVNFRDDFPQMAELRRMTQGGCVEIGLRARVEYLRTTKGRKADYVFDPNFPESLRNRDGKEMSGDALRELLDTALRFRAPLMVTLDGGVWADAKFALPEYDIVDMLEQDERAVQWNQFGKSEPDDALNNLPGATDSPELARMMSLNRYNRRFLEYKKRNLQAAVREIVRFNRAHPEIFVMVNFDPDQYINPWFYLTQWYDYNPDTLRQYREWLFQTGPYADGEELAFSRHKPMMSLNEANRLARQNWKTLDEVEPPRESIDYSDPWQQLWTQFKRHLVARHYDDLAAWTEEAGLSPERIYTSQTFIQADVSVTTSDTATGWPDQAGVSIEGAKPRRGHLGVILYGPSSRNEGRSRSGSSLIDSIRRTDAEWGIVEFHPATIAFPDKLPTHAEAYATMQALINGGARFLSPMWGTYAGDRVVHPNNFKAYDAMEGTAHEYQIVWWLREMRSLPAGSMYYPFGNELLASTDGWSTGAETRMVLDPGKIRLSGSGARVRLVAPVRDELPLLSGARIKISGKWPGNVTVLARLEFADGSRDTLAPFRSNTNNVAFRIEPPTQPTSTSMRSLRRLEFEWRRKGAGTTALQGIEVDAVVLNPDNN